MKNKLGNAGLMLVCGSIVLTLALGIRHSFGLFLQPVSADNGWGREVFSFAIALQNLLWGFTQPFTGMLADRFDRRHYNSYVVVSDYHRYRLPPPRYGQHYYRDNDTGEILLIAAATGLVLWALTN